MGVSAVVRNRKTIAIFTDPDTQSYKSFMANLEHIFKNDNLICIFFPLSNQERIDAVSFRRVRGQGLLASCPVVQVGIWPDLNCQHMLSGEDFH